MPEIQFLPLHAGQRKIYRSKAKRKAARCGRRYGKTTMCEQIASNWAANQRRVGWFAPSYKILLPSYKAIRALLAPITVSASKTDMIIELQGGGSVEFWTLDNEDAGRSRKYHNVIVDEAGLVKKGLKDIWEQAIEPTLLDYDGDAFFTGTPKGVDQENFFYEIFHNPKLGFELFHAPTYANPKIRAMAYERIIAGKPPMVIQQEYEAEFVDWRGQNFFKLDWLLEDMKPVPMPTHCSTIYSIMDCASKVDVTTDGSATVWFALEQLPEPHLIILDWEYVQMEGYFLQNLVPLYLARNEELVRLCGARYGNSGLHIEDKSTGTVLIQQGASKGWNVRAIDSGLTALGKEERAINISGYVASGKVKISQYAYDKMVEFKGQSKNHFLFQVLQFIIGEKDQADDLFDCFNYGVALGLGNSDGF